MVELQVRVKVGLEGKLFCHSVEKTFNSKRKYIITLINALVLCINSAFSASLLTTVF